MIHKIVIDTKPATGRKPDPPRSRFECSCGARGKLTTPLLAAAAGDGHVADALALEICGAAPGDKLGRE